MGNHEVDTHKFRLKVTAGSVHDSSTHQVVPVNGETLRIENEHAIVSLCVRIKDYTGMKISYLRKTPTHLVLDQQGTPKVRPPPAHTLSTLCMRKICTPYASQSSSKSP